MIFHFEKAISEFDLDQLNAEIEAFCEQHDVAPRKLYIIELVIEELVTNMIKYGSRANPDETVRVELKAAAAGVGLILSDNTAPFNPLEVATPDTTMAAEERNIGGLGIFLVRQKVQSLSYQYINGRNVISAII